MAEAKKMFTSFENFKNFYIFNEKSNFPNDLIVLIFLRN